MVTVVGNRPQFVKAAAVSTQDRELEVGSGSHAEQTAAILTRLEPLVRELQPDALLVYGDTNSTLGGALVAAKASVGLVHVEAGMRSWDRSSRSLPYATAT